MKAKGTLLFNNKITQNFFEGKEPGFGMLHASLIFHKALFSFNYTCTSI